MCFEHTHIKYVHTHNSSSIHTHTNISITIPDINICETRALGVHQVTLHQVIAHEKGINQEGT